jgi:hypothetical protein
VDGTGISMPDVSREPQGDLKSEVQPLDYAVVAAHKKSRVRRSATETFSGRWLRRCMASSTSFCADEFEGHFFERTVESSVRSYFRWHRSQDEYGWAKEIGPHHAVSGCVHASELTPVVGRQGVTHIEKRLAW